MKDIKAYNQRLINRAMKKLRGRVATGLEQSAATHAGLYQRAVSENRGVRPIPFTQGPPGNPYRSQPGQYPFEDPDTEPEQHGYEFIAFALDRKRLIARSGLKKEGMHLFELSHGPEYTAEFGARLGMDQTFSDNLRAIRAAFIAGATGGSA